MASRMTSLPRGGETIYEIIRVRTWLADRYATYATNVPDRFFLDWVGESDRKRYGKVLGTCTRHYLAFIERRAFVDSELGRRHMAYGRWVERETYPALYNRLSVASQHPAWSNFGLEDRVRLASATVFASLLRAGAERAGAWDGMPPPREEPLEFIDRWGARHLVSVDAIPVATRFGYGPSGT